MKCLRVLAVAVTLGLVGCAQETSTTKETTVETPGGTATVTEEKKIETTGENPPAVTDTPGAPVPANP